MRLIKSILGILIILSTNSVVLSDTPYFLDFKYILNESEAGKKPKNTLRIKLLQDLKR